MQFVAVQPVSADDGPWLRLAIGSCDAPDYTAEVPAGSTLLVLSGGLMPSSPFEFIIAPQGGSTSQPYLNIDQTVTADSNGTVCAEAFATTIDDYGQYGITIHGLRANQHAYNTFTVVNIQAAPIPTDTPAPTATATSEPTETPAPTQTPELTVTPEPTTTITPEPTETPAPTSTPELTVTPEPTSTATPEPTGTPAPTQTPELTVTPVSTVVPTSTPTPKPTHEPSATPSPTVVVTEAPTDMPGSSISTSDTGRSSTQKQPAASASAPETTTDTSREAVVGVAQPAAVVASANHPETKQVVVLNSENTTNHEDQSHVSKSAPISMHPGFKLEPSGITKVSTSAATGKVNPQNVTTDRILIVVVAGLSLLVTMCAWYVFRFR